MAAAKIVGVLGLGLGLGCRGEAVVREPAGVSAGRGVADGGAGDVEIGAAGGEAGNVEIGAADGGAGNVENGVSGDGGAGNVGSGGGDAGVAAPSWAAVGAWGVEIAVPAGAKVVHEAAADRHTIYMGYGVQVGLVRVDLAAPAGLSAALREWDQGDELRKFGEGTTPEGVMYAVRAFRVRDGRSSGGRHVHFFIAVARVYAVLAVSASRRVECTGYVEHDVDGPEDAELAAVRAVCLSLRRARGSAL